ncbi:MAG: CapA family protein [Tissierella sp.]|uniref:CapA family protein n=1 Tax=Tissierella sp. TaxID=41274 RepID=UPI003F989023
MSRQNRRAKRRREKIIRRRRIILLIFILILIPILYKGSRFIINGGKTLYSSIQGKGDKSKDVPPNKKDTPDIEKPVEPEIKSAKILSVGDIMFHMPQVKASYLGNGNYDFRDDFKYVKKYIDNADISIANFETVTAGNDKKFSGFPQFNSPKETLFALKETGFDIISTANNHSLDQGKEGVINTIKYAKEYRLKNVGTYEKPQTEYLIQEKNGIKLGFLAYTYGLNGLDFYLSEEELGYMINLIDEEKIKSDIESIKEEVDLVVASVHWGNEYEREPNDSQIDLGHKMVEWGANIVLGSHPHVLQRSEIIKKDGKDNFIIYSQGNFFSNQRGDTMGNTFTEDGVMVEIDIEKDITNDKTFIKNIEFLPTWIDKYNKDGKDVYRILPTKDALDNSIEVKLSDSVKNRINKSQSDSMETLNYE